MDKFTHCVKCGAEKIAALECPSCGAIYAKAERLYKEPPPKVQPCPACGKTNQQLTDKRKEKSIDALPGIAHIQCKHLVTSVLKAPATAKFPLSSPANDVGNKTFYVASYVDSQNSFGALLRSNWSCKIHFKGGDPFEAGSWDLLDLHVD